MSFTIYVCNDCECVYHDVKPSRCENCHEIEFTRYVKSEELK